MDTSRRLLKTYVITLPEAVQRRRFMEAQLAHFPFMDVEFVNGVRGADLSPDETSRVVDDAMCVTTIGRHLGPGEVGSTLSHLEVMRRVERENVPVALVLEDDPIISGRLGGIISSMVAGLETDGPGIILLTPCKYFRGGGRSINKDFALRPFFDGFYAGGYLVNLEAARRIPRALVPLRAHLDWWKITGQLSGVEVEALVPYCVGISISENTVSYIDVGPGGRTQMEQTAPQGPQGVVARCVTFGRRVRQGVSEKARGIRAQRLVF